MLTHGDYNYKINIKGFHGTSLRVANKIIKDKEFKLGDLREDHWLGQGSYFFRDDFDQAKTWSVFKLKGTEDGAVLEATIEIDNENFLNLDSRGGYNFFRGFFKEFKKHCHEQRINLTNKTATELRCLVCNQLPEEVKVIQRTFKTTSATDRELVEVELGLNGVQLCIRDKDILDFEKIKIVGLIPTKVFKGKRSKGRRRRRPITLQIEESDIHEI
ncbi:hypothetical protein [Bacillus velezensis]|uniref:hypothetical protein n=1 Tax=Bacillus velezensis TaxID=492670 RepID=UPI000E5A52FC|nr:hypothetical protein [Bacillus velezensis]